MTVKLLYTTMLLNTLILLTFVLNGVYCKDSETSEDLKDTAPSLKERIINAARSDWDSLSTANLNGVFNTLVYQIDDLDFPLGFNTTKSSTVAILGHFLIILTGVYFLSLLPSGSLDGLIPKIPRLRRKGWGRKRRRRPQPFYADYDYNEYEDDYEYGFRHKYGPPLDHHKRLLRHGPPVFNRRMSDDVKPQNDKKMHRRNNFESMISDVDVDDMNVISDAGRRHSAKLTKREARSDVSILEKMMNFALGPFNRFQRSYGQLFEHYVDFWRFKLSSDGSANQKKSSSGPRIPPPPGLLEGIRSLNRGTDNVLSRLVTGVQRVAGVKAQRRSFNPSQPRRNLGGHNRRRFRHGQNRPHHDESRSFSEVEEHYGPPPALSAEQVQALHEK